MHKYIVLAAILALGTNAAQADISFNELQRNTECRNFMTGEAVNEESIGIGSWSSDIDLANIGIAHALQISDIQVDGSTLTASGHCEASLAMEQEDGVDYLHSWTSMRLSVYVSEESTFEFSCTMTENVTLGFWTEPVHSHVVEPGQYHFSGTLSAGERLDALLDVSQDFMPDGIGENLAAADFDLTIVPTGTVPTEETSWSAVKSLFR